MNFEPRVKTAVEAPDGRILGLDYRRIFEKPFVHLTNPPNNAVALVANQASAPFLMSVSGEGPTEVFWLSAQRTGAARVKLMIQDGQEQRALMNVSVHIDTIFGSGAQPYRLPEALYIDEKRAILAILSDLSGVANTVRLAAGAKRFTQQQFDPKGDRIRKRLEAQQYISCPFWYTLDQGQVTLAPSATLNATINLADSFHFELHKISAVATQLFNIEIVNQATGESIIDAPSGDHFPISSGLIVGTNNFPFMFPEPVLYEAGTKLLVTLVNRSAIANATIDLTLGGIAYARRMWR